MTPRIYVHAPAEIPKVEHWAIIGSVSFHIPGDERSRTNPGHGYPERTETAVDYVAYLDEAEFRTDLLTALANKNSSVRGIHVTAERYELVLSLGKADAT